MEQAERWRPSHVPGLFLGAGTLVPVDPTRAKTDFHSFRVHTSDLLRRSRPISGFPRQSQIGDPTASQEDLVVDGSHKIGPELELFGGLQSRLIPQERLPDGYTVRQPDLYNRVHGVLFKLQMHESSAIAWIALFYLVTDSPKVLNRIKVTIIDEPRYPPIPSAGGERADVVPLSELLDRLELPDSMMTCSGWVGGCIGHSILLTPPNGEGDHSIFPPLEFPKNLVIVSHAGRCLYYLEHHISLNFEPWKRMSVLLAEDRTGIDIDEMVCRSQRGDLEAFDRIVAYFHPLTYRTAYRVLGCHDRAEDAVQEIFVKAWSRLSTFKAHGSFSAWLHTIAMNHCLNLVRGRARESQRLRPMPYDDGLDEVIPSPHRSFDPRQRERDLVIHEAVYHLPEKLRVVVVLLYFGDGSMEEVAAELQIPVNTVRSRYRSAREQLRRSLSGWEGDR